MFHVFFQIWLKRDEDRILEKKIIEDGFKYSKNNYDVVLRRVGALAGKCYKNNGTKYSIQSHYFIKFDESVLCHLDAIMIKN